MIPSTVRWIGFSDGIGIFENCPQPANVFYVGTIEDGNAIEKTEDWESGAVRFTVRCDDGPIQE